MIPGGLQIGRLSRDGKLGLVAPGIQKRVEELGGLKGLAAVPTIRSMPFRLAPCSE
jgi:hypothetical protein